MNMPPDLMSMPATSLLQHVQAVCSELGILQVSDAPEAELKQVQRKVDEAMQELDRRMSW